MMFFAEYNALCCGKEEEREAVALSSQHSVKELNCNGCKGTKIRSAASFAFLAYFAVNGFGRVLMAEC
jgi:hypothetical protein